MPIKYQEGKIYKINNTVNDYMYVGSTTLKLCERMKDHRYCINNKTKQDYPLYKAFIEHGVGHFLLNFLKNAHVMILKS